MRSKVLVPLAAIAVIAGLGPGGSARAGDPPDAATCAVCHEEVAAAFPATDHGRAMAAASRGDLERSCAVCHEPSPEHLEDPSSDNVRRLPGPAACLACHEGRRAGLLLTTPAHARNGVECLDCHAGGAPSAGDPHVLAVPDPERCAGCHRGESSLLHLPSAHRESGQRPFSCLACHEIHGAGVGGRLDVMGAGGACLECHREKAVPYIYPHPSVEVDGCLACHEPHGSMNPRLLTRRRVADLCLECHAGISAFHDLTQARYRACQTCHTAVHGSNHDPRLLRE